MMGNKFKAGATVRAVRDTHSDHEKHPAGTVFVVGASYTGAIRAGEFVAGPAENPDRYILPEEDFELVPALDPSKVKAGDTVTLERGAPHPAKIEGVVQEVKTYHAFEPKPLRFYIGGYLFSPYDYTLVDHQPAPEPEPEWKPGTVAVIEVDGDHTYYRAIRNAGGQWDAENAWTYADIEVTDVRPLVVIDPETVDADAVYEAVLPLVEHDLGTGISFRVKVTVRKVLAHLGIEAR